MRRPQRRRSGGSSPESRASSEPGIPASSEGDKGFVSHPRAIIWRMTTSHANDLVSGLYEPCTHFTGEDVCECCGWLEHEHQTRLAVTPSAASPALVSSSPS